MGLEEILKDMEREASLRVEEILSTAEAEGRSVIARAEEEAKKVREGHLASARKRLLRERERQVSAARLEAQRELAAAREDWLDQAWAAARERLQRLRCEPRYARHLERLTREAVSELGSPIRIEIDPKDEKVMGEIVCALGIEMEMGSSLSAIGGLRASTTDGCIHIVSTVEARLERARGELRQKLAALLGSQEVSWRATTATPMPGCGR